MTIPTPRAALKQLLARLDQTTDKDGPVPAWMDSYCTAVQALKAEPEPGAKPSLDDVYGLCEEFGFYLEGDTDESAGVLRDMITAALARWRAPVAEPVATPATQEPDGDRVQKLAAIIRGLPRAWSYQFAQALLVHPGFSGCHDGPTAPAPETPAEALAARPLLEQVAAMADCIGAQTVGQVTAISNRAAAWLRQNPPGQPVAIEPRGCPTPGGCSCVEPAPPATEPGEVGELVEFLAPSREQAGAISLDAVVKLRRVATLLQQQAAELAALRGVLVAVSQRENGFMGGVCVALATVTAHGDSVIWREIVRSVGVDNALNYAANVNPEDWELAGFSKYAQPELGKDKPLPAPQAGEGK